MGKLRVILAFVAVLAVSLPASAEVLWDQSFAGSSVGTAGLMYLGLASLEENMYKADDFVLSEATGTTIQKVTIYAIDYIDNLHQPVRASVVFYENDTLAGGAGENINRPKNGVAATPNARPTDWSPAGKTTEEIADYFPWDATKGDGTYLEGDNDGWIYKAVCQVDGHGLTVTDTGYTVGGNTVWQLEIELPTELTLSADTRYWLSFAVSAQTNWLDGDPGNNGESWGAPVMAGQVLAGGWEGNVNNRLWGGGYDFFFKLEGTPEPATMSLLGLGGLGLLLRRKR